MKKLFFLLSAGLLLCACNDENDDPKPVLPPEKIDLQETLCDSYWVENTFLLSEREGREVCSDLTLMRLKYPREVPDGPMQYRVGNFFHVGEDGAVTVYVVDASLPEPEIMRFENCYECGFDGDPASFSMKALRTPYIGEGLFDGVRVTLREATDDGLLFDAGINDHIRAGWSQWIDADTKALRSVWMRRTLAEIEAQYGDLDQSVKR